jgi:hypothetical protein
MLSLWSHPNGVLKFSRVTRVMTKPNFSCND